MTAGTPMRPLPRRAEPVGAETTLIAARHGPSAQEGGVWHTPLLRPRSPLRLAVRVTRPDRAGDGRA